MSSITDCDAGTPQLPFGERSAKALYKALLDVEEVLNPEKLKMLQLCRQMPAHTVDARKEKAEVKALLVRQPLSHLSSFSVRFTPSSKMQPHPPTPCLTMPHHLTSPLQRIHQASQTQCHGATTGLLCVLHAQFTNHYLFRAPPAKPFSRLASHIPS